jgi:hypothetical protein
VESIVALTNDRYRGGGVEGGHWRAQQRPQTRAPGLKEKTERAMERAGMAQVSERELSPLIQQVNTRCTAPSLIPTVNGNTVRSFSTQSAAKGSSTTVSRSDIRSIQYLDSSALGVVRRWRLIGYFLILPPIQLHK